MLNPIRSLLYKLGLVKLIWVRSYSGDTFLRILYKDSKNRSFVRYYGERRYLEPNKIWLNVKAWESY